MLSIYRTKIVATIGPASETPETLAALIRAGMSVARLNFSHGEPAHHREVARRIRAASEAEGRPVCILADLPGPKIRIGELTVDPVELEVGGTFTLTTEDVPGGRDRVSVAFPSLPYALSPGDRVFLNDGFIELAVTSIDAPEVACRVCVGGELRSRKGVNLPHVDLGVSAFTEHDRACLRVALDAGVDVVSQSFVASAADVTAVRQAAEERGHSPFVIVKIERAAALKRLDEILDAADGIMVARGDLGVEIPVEQIAVTQKRLLREANRRGMPAITATHMLESMTQARRPTRAEATDVANAILDGTDAVMLSSESAVGRFPVESVAMLASIAAATEPHLATLPSAEPLGIRSGKMRAHDVISTSVERALEDVDAVMVFVPTISGATARSIARRRTGRWIVAASPSIETVRRLQLTRGVHPLLVPDEAPDWRVFARDWLRAQGIAGGAVILIEGPSEANPHRSHRMEVFDTRSV